MIALYEISRETIMQITTESIIVTSDRRPWNKGKFIGPKPPLQPRQVWAIRTRLQLAGRVRDLALFNLAIDSKLRGCDVVSLPVEDVAQLDKCLWRSQQPNWNARLLDCLNWNQPTYFLLSDGASVRLGAH